MLAHQTPQTQTHCSAHAFGAKQGAPSRTRTHSGHSTSPLQSHTAHPHLTTLSPTPQLAGPRTWAWRWEKQGTSQRGPLAYFPRHFFFFVLFFPESIT